MSRLATTRAKIYATIARQLHGVVPCWVCGAHVPPDLATLEHIRRRSEGGSSHLENLAISHGSCNRQRHAADVRHLTAHSVEADCTGTEQRRPTAQIAETQAAEAQAAGFTCRRFLAR